jgi:hypothetical protein
VLSGHVSAHRFAEALGHAVQVARAHRVVSLDLTLDRVAGNGMNARCKDNPPATGRLGGHERVMGAADIRLQQRLPGRLRRRFGREVYDCVPAVKNVLQFIHVGQVHLNRLSVLPDIRQGLLRRVQKRQVILGMGAGCEIRADTSAGPGDQNLTALRRRAGASLGFDDE